MKPEVAWILRQIAGEDPLSCLISAEDEARYHRSGARERRELLAGRGAVRDLLTATRWAQWRGLATDEHGRPHLPNSSSVDLSISHSHGWILAGVCRGARIGVDVEKVTSVFGEASLRRLSCTDEERTKLASAPDRHRNALLADMWTRKESFLKARGTGLKSDPREVSASDRRVAQICSGDTGLSAALTLLPLGP